MRPLTTLLRALAALVAVLLLAPLAPAGGSQPAPASAPAGTKATTYTCQYAGVESEAAVPGGLPAPDLPSSGGSDPVKVSVAVKAPKQVEAGRSLKLKGTATFTFGPNATATNASTVFTFLSDSFGLDVADGLSSRFLRITDLKTSRSTPDSSVVKASWTLPDYLVPTTSTGPLTLSLPYQATASNPVSATPGSVAFTGALATDSAVQPNRAVACALDQDAKQPVVATVKVTGGDPTAGTGSTSGGSTGSSSSGSSAGGTTPAAPSAPSAGAPPGSAPPASGDPGAAPVTADPTLLAGEPIPPATVGDGVHLPPWSMMFVGVFLAGGLFLAFSSRRRLRQLTVASFLLALLVVAPTPLNRPAPAEAATGQAQITMICVYEAEGSNSNEEPKDQPTGISMTLNVPDSVKPGETLTLTGQASVQAPEDIRNQASQLGYTQLDAISDWFSVGLTVGGGKRQVFLADRWQTGKTAFSNPLVVRGPLYFPAFQVPKDATGSIRLELPRNEVVDRRPPPYQNRNTPPKVAVEFLAEVSGNGTSATYIVSCWRNDGGDGLIAEIPVSNDAGASGGGSAEAPAEGGAAPAAPGAAQQPGAPGAGASSAAPGQAGTPGQSGSAAVPGAGTAADPALTGATADPTGTGSQDVVVPAWLVFLLGGLAIAAYGLAFWNNLRIRTVLNKKSGGGGA